MPDDTLDAPLIGVRELSPVEMLGLQELAEYWRVSPTTVRRWNRERRIPRALKINGRGLRWRAVDLVRFLACDCSMAAYLQGGAAE